MTIEEIRRKKRDHGYTNTQMAELSGLPLATVQKVLGGTTKAPRYQTIQALASVFAEERAEKDESRGLYSSFIDRSTAERTTLSEPGAAYAQKAVPGDGDGTQEVRYPYQGHYTIADYLALPDEQRVELIDGVFYDMGAPTTPHQLIGGEVYALFLDFLLKKKGSCIPFVSPVDVQLDRDDRTMVQPDVCIVCDRSKINRQRICGAPDFVMEVFSPSTKMKDILIKWKKYQEAGVKEYWMVDPEQKMVIKVLFSEPEGEYTDGDLKMETIPFSQPVSVGIFGDECVIDFGEITGRYAFLFE